VVYAELRPAQGEALAGMPSLIWPLSGHPVLPSVYTTSPARYADGRWYLKIGGPLHTPLTLDTPAAILGWFRGPGNPAEIAGLRETLLAIVPGLDVISWGHKVCMTSYTAHGLPYIDRLAEGLFVCAGGCGAAAKSSDAIGRLGAEFARHDEWRDPLPAAGFRAVFRAE
jgi:sarcosine oxidase